MNKVRNSKISTYNIFFRNFSKIKEALQIGSGSMIYLYISTLIT